MASKLILIAALATMACVYGRNTANTNQVRFYGTRLDKLRLLIFLVHVLNYCPYKEPLRGVLDPFTTLVPSTSITRSFSGPSFLEVERYISVTTK